MKKAISALFLAALLSALGTTAVLAAPSEQGMAHGLSHVCTKPHAAFKNKHCGWRG
jgi:hypothetical protein